MRIKNKKPRKLRLIELIPEGMPEYVIPAWLACVRWSVTEPEIVEAFVRDTGEVIPSAPRTVIEATVDEACGRDLKVIRAFFKWFNKSVWGETYAETESN
jgi:hypothetical protein